MVNGDVLSLFNKIELSFFCSCNKIFDLLTPQKINYFLSFFVFFFFCFPKQLLSKVSSTKNSFRVRSNIKSMKQVSPVSLPRAIHPTLFAHTKDVMLPNQWHWHWQFLLVLLIVNTLWNSILYYQNLKVKAKSFVLSCGDQTKTTTPTTFLPPLLTTLVKWYVVSIRDT